MITICILQFSLELRAHIKRIDWQHNVNFTVVESKNLKKKQEKYDLNYNYYYNYTNTALQKLKISFFDIKPLKKHFYFKNFSNGGQVPFTPQTITK